MYLDTQYKYEGMSSYGLVGVVGVRSSSVTDTI